MDFLTSLLPAIEHFQFLGYWIVLLVSFLESVAFVGLAIPGTLFVILVGFVSAKGFLDLGDVIWFAAIGVIMGDMLSYYFGSHAKRFFSANNRILNSKYLKKGEAFFVKYGGRSIFLDRFIGPVRPVITFIAGMLKMEKGRFFTWSVFSGFSWVAIFILIGFFFGQAWKTIVMWSTRGSIFLAVFIGLVFAFYAAKRFIAKNGKQILSFVISLWCSIKQAIASNPRVRRFVGKHPAFFAFIRGRLDKNKFSGLPLTLFFLVFVYAAFLFAGIVEDVITVDTIVSVDIRVASLLATFRSAAATKFFLFVTVLGKWQVVSVFAFAAVGVLWLLRKRLYIIPLLLTILGSEIFTAFGKIVFHRPRPELAVYVEHSFSFPSGHATIAAAFYGFLIYVLVRIFRKWTVKVNVFFVGVAVILLIGFSRLYLGVHYVSDVWGGYLVGVSWLIAGIGISEWLTSVKKSRVRFLPRVWLRITSAALIIASLLFYTAFAINYDPQILRSAHLQENRVIQSVSDIFSSEQLKYTETLTGERQEPISFIIFAENDGQFASVFTDAGWVVADAVSISSIMRLAKAVFLKQSYSQAPMTPSFWDMQVHTFGFEKSTESNTVNQRHHARFWRTRYISENGKRVYIGTASLDAGIKWGITHMIEPAIDTEREFLFADLKKVGVLTDVKKQKFVAPTLGQNFSGDMFFTDGRAYMFLID